MNEKYLKQVADLLVENHGSSFENVYVVFPNKRPKSFLVKELSTILQRAFFLPNVYSINELCEKLSRKKIGSLDDLIPVLFKSTQKVLKEISFDYFLSIYNILISDFNNINLHCSNADEIYSNQLAAKKIEMWNPEGTEPSIPQKNLLKFWSSIPEIFKEFNSQLLNESISYQGYVYKLASENIEKSEFKNKQIYICGFNALFEIEQNIFDALKINNTCKFLWDYDAMYNEKHIEAGVFLNKNKFYKNNTFNVIADKNYWNTEKNITVYAAAQNILQAKIAAEIIIDLPEEEHNDTAIVLADSNLLIPVLQFLPDEKINVNVSMGYPLKLTNAHKLIESFIEVYTLFKLSDNGVRISGNTIKKMFTNPLFSLYLKNEYGINYYPHLEKCPEYFYDLKYIEFIFIPPSIESNKVISEIFSYNITSAAELNKFLLNLLNSILKYSNDYEFSETEALEIFRDSLGKIDKYIIKGNSISLFGFKYFFHLFSSGKNIDLLGEPILGLQIMGLLETRCLDFKNVIILSCNEGFLPPDSPGNSFIPEDIKRSFGWFDFFQKDAIYAFHFYRFLQRAKNIHLIYNTSKDEFNSGEVSRFINQLRMSVAPQKGNIKLDFYNAFPELNYKLINRQDVSIKLSQTNFNFLKQKLSQKGISATSLIAFKNCSLKFYFEYILGIKEEEEKSEELKHAEIGSLIHLSLEKIYTKNIGLNITDIIIPTIEEIEKIVTISFNELFNSAAKTRNANTGINYLLINYCAKQINKYLQKEKDILKTYPNHKILALELKLEKKIRIKDIDILCIGKADRIDSNNEQLLIYDFKTGKVESKDLIIRKEDIENISDKAFQLMYYSWLFFNFNDTQSVKSEIVALRTHKNYFNTLVIDNQINFTEDEYSFTNSIIEEQLHKIMDENNVFEKTDDLNKCKYCGFKFYCNR